MAVDIVVGNGIILITIIAGFWGLWVKKNPLPPHNGPAKKKSLVIVTACLQTFFTSRSPKGENQFWRKWRVPDVFPKGQTTLSTKSRWRFRTKRRSKESFDYTRLCTFRFHINRLVTVRQGKTRTNVEYRSRAARLEDDEMTKRVFLHPLGISYMMYATLAFSWKLSWRLPWHRTKTWFYTECGLALRCYQVVVSAIAGSFLATTRVLTLYQKNYVNKKKKKKKKKRQTSEMILFGKNGKHTGAPPPPPQDEGSAA